MKQLLLLVFVLIVLVPVDIQRIELNPESKETIIVEIRGHVLREGEFELKRGSTVQDLMDVAGLYEDSAIEGLNPFQILHHHDVLTIMQKTEEVICINSATLDELMTLPGIGEATALRIIEYRNEHLFQTLEELMEVKGIGEKKFEALKGKIGL